MHVERSRAAHVHPNVLVDDNNLFADIVLQASAIDPAGVLSFPCQSSEIHGRYFAS